MLELVQVYPPGEQINRALDSDYGCSAIRADRGAVHQSDEHRLVAGDEGRHAPDIVRAGELLVLGPYGCECGTGVDPGEDRLRVYLVLIEHAFDDVAVL